MTRRAAITGTGLWAPPETISNAELVASHSEAAQRFNDANAAAIAEGRTDARVETDEAFIEKASGVQSRHVMDKRGVLDPERQRPLLPTRGEDELSIQAEMAVAAAEQALARAGREAREVDAILVACSNLQRAYPAVAIEVQQALGAEGWGYDLNVACSSATFGLQAATDAIANGSARVVLAINPEITSGHNNFQLRDHHFIFGDACTATVVEAVDDARAETVWEILSTRLQTRFSNNIRNDFGFLNASEETPRPFEELVFRQNGRKVFREVCPMVAKHIAEHLADEHSSADALRRMWLHQANLNMNELIAKTLLGRPPERDEAPVILDEFANTSSAGCLIAFHQHSADLAPGELGILCSFGAGYSIGSVLLRRQR